MIAPNHTIKQYIQTCYERRTYAYLMQSHEILTTAFETYDRAEEGMFDEDDEMEGMDMGMEDRSGRAPRPRARAKQLYLQK